MFAQQLDTTGTFEIVNEIEAIGMEVRRKANAACQSHVSMAYYQTSLEMRRILHRHIAKGHCAACLADEARRHGAASIAGLTQDSSVLSYSAVTQ
jgi:hypothetical protein